eukprot:2914515-Rhodomonas_salina.2
MASVPWKLSRVGQESVAVQTDSRTPAAGIATHIMIHCPQPRLSDLKSGTAASHRVTLSPTVTG